MAELSCHGSVAATGTRKAPKPDAVAREPAGRRGGGGGGRAEARALPLACVMSPRRRPAMHAQVASTNLGCAPCLAQPDAPPAHHVFLGPSTYEPMQPAPRCRHGPAALTDSPARGQCGRRGRRALICSQSPRAWLAANCHLSCRTRGLTELSFLRVLAIMERSRARAAARLGRQRRYIRYMQWALCWSCELPDAAGYGNDGASPWGRAVVVGSPWPLPAPRREARRRLAFGRRHSRSRRGSSARCGARDKNATVPTQLGRTTRGFG